jgi:carbon monoxide dehydrogenase subunit G
MQFSGSQVIKAPLDSVFAFVIDPNKVGWCGPGVESIEMVDETHFKAKAKVGVGFISARFSIDMELAEVTAPNHAVIKAKGQAPGSAAHGTGTMNLLPGDEPNTTLLVWAADVIMTGLIASVGQRLIEGTANKLVKQSFECIRAKLEA